MYTNSLHMSDSDNLQVMTQLKCKEFEGFQHIEMSHLRT